MKIGGYARIWFRDGSHVDGQRVAPEDSERYEADWREAGARVEWLLSPKGRLDVALPQTLPRLAHNANVRSWIERRRTR